MSFEFYAVSAPTSPRGSFPDQPGNASVGFYSAPPSPIGKNLKPLYIPEAEESCSCNQDEFEFETSRRFAVVDPSDSIPDHKSDDANWKINFRKSRRERMVSLPTMAFADELFSDGKVMPLKPPPGHNSGSQSQCSTTTTTPTASSPVSSSPVSILRRPFRRRTSLWNDEFDPFVAALESVKEGHDGEDPRANNHRRARSMSPLRFTGIVPEDQFSMNGSTEPAKSKVGEAHKVPLAPVKLSEPKGVLLARRASKLKEEWPEEPTITCNFHSKQHKRKSKKSFLFRSKSASKLKDSDSEQTDQNAKTSKSRLLKRLSLKPTKAVQHNEEKTMYGEVTQRPHTQFRRPKLLQCVGLGAELENH